jgi:hypothetical protein
MPRGGKRAGAGRKKGSATKKTREIADKAAAEGITPLEVMLWAMRKHYAAEQVTEAVEVAHLAAPYCHARLNAVEVSGPGGEAIPMIQFVEAVRPDARSAGAA